MSRPSVASAFSTRTACATISGPMPSPARTAIFMPLKQPRLRGAVLRLERLDLVGVFQREADVVEAVQDAMLAKRIDLELKALAARRRHGLSLQVHREAVTFRRRCFLEQHVHDPG